jgi:4-amino-4-deoxy-L-arabinose transferase-like glycosyltransferase
MKHNRHFDISLKLVFVIFVISNGIIAYSGLPFWLKLSVGFAGLFFPFLALLFSNSKNFLSKPGEIQNNTMSHPSSWVFIPLVTCLLFLRFYKLSSFSTWPSTDEGWLGAYALDLYEKWNWNILFGYIKFPALTIWPETLFFKLFGPSLFSLYLLPAVISSLTVFLTYLAAKEFFSKEFSFLCAAIASFGFWFLLLGRIALVGDAIPAWELVGLLLISRIFKKKQGESPALVAALLGVVAASGFYFFIYCWTTYWVWLNFFFLWLGFRQKKTGSFFIFLFAQMVCIAPLLIALIRSGALEYVKGLLLFNRHSVWLSGGFNSLCYLTSLLWWADPSGFIYRPQWGGFLNPVSGSFFLFGLAYVLSQWKDPVWRWVLFAFPFFLLPGLLSQTFEMYRIVALVPLVLLMTAMGIQVLWNYFPKHFKIFLTLFLISISLDTYHLFGVYRQVWASPGIQWRPFKSLERWRAFELLEQQSQTNGPGLIMADFIVRNFDRTLDIATYSFNCAENRSLDRSKPGWVAVIVPDHLKPFISSRFADGKWYELSDELPASNENKCLGIIPWSETHQDIFNQWERANRAFKEVNRQMLYSNHQLTFQEYENVLLSIRPELGNDPLIESCFDQKILGAFDNKAEPQKAFYFIQRAVKYGYPSTYFVQELSDLKKWKKKG